MDTLEKYSSIPATRKAIASLQAGAAVVRLSASTITAITDNSTGTNTGPLVDIPTLRTKFTHVTGNDLVTKTAFDTAVGTANDAIAVLKTAINEYGTPMGADFALAGGNGNVAVAGTIPAVTKAVTGSDGATAVAADRPGVNAAFLNIRDNLATLVQAYNRIVTALGAPASHKVAAVGGMTARSGLTLSNNVTSGSAVANTGDAASKVYVDATATKVANNIAHLGKKLTDFRTWFNANKVDLEP